jgi:hypothetical protein
MPMPPYPLVCYTQGCNQPAVYKIAARWSDGVTGELKTYGLSCAACLPAWFRRARARRAACRMTAGETLDEPGVYALVRGQRDPQLQRLPEVEAQLAAGAPSAPPAPDGPPEG